MSVGDTLRHLGAGIFVEGPAKKKSYAQWVAALDATGQAIDRQAAATGDPVKARKLLRHISGIERWGQSRLRVFLGAPFVRDEYDGYQPGATLSLDEQSAFWRATREKTIALAQTLAAAKIADAATVVHNDLGPLTARAGCATWRCTHASK